MLGSTFSSMLFYTHQQTIRFDYKLKKHFIQLQTQGRFAFQIRRQYVFISIYFVQNQVRLQSQNTNEQDNQAHNMLSQLPAVKDRKVKQQYNWTKYI